MQGVFAHIPNTSRLKMSLPFQVVGDKSLTATLLLALTFATLAQRAEEHSALETLVLDHVSDTTINNICHNPIDLKHAIGSFKELKTLVLSFKRQEKRNSSFNRNLWFLIRKASKLASLCLVGWNVKRGKGTRRHRPRGATAENDWRMRSLPYPLDTDLTLQCLRFLELKRLDIAPNQLVRLIEDCSMTLKELYLIEVYIKVNGAADEDNIALWIGLQGSPRPPGACWVAQELRNMETLNLDILRVSGLGYDDFEPDEESHNPNYDLVDPNNFHDKGFDRRFVEAVTDPDFDITRASTLRIIIEDAMDSDSPADEAMDATSPAASLPEASIAEVDTTEMLDVETPEPPSPVPGLLDYDAETYQLYHNTTSQFKRSIDGYFTNHNEQALQEIQNLINVADRGMSLINQEIERYQVATVDPATGGIVTAPTPWQ